jgi:hypothetical protein
MHYDLHLVNTAAEYLEFIDSLLADNKNLVSVMECVDGGVRIPIPTQIELYAAPEWQLST